VSWPRSPHGILAVLLLINLLVYIGRYLLSAVLPLARDTLGTDQQTMGFLGTTFVIAYFVPAPVIGALGDRLSRARMVVIGYLLSSIATLVVLWVSSMTPLLLTRLLLGIGQSIFIVAVQPLLSDLFGPERRASALGVFYIAQPVGTAASFVIGGVLVGLGWHWSQTFGLVGAASLLLSPLILSLPEPIRGAAEQVSEKRLRDYLAPKLALRRYLPLLSNRSFILNALASTANSFSMGGLAFWMPSYLHHRLSLSVGAASTSFGLITASAGAIGTALGGWLADAAGRRVASGPVLVCGIAMLAAVPSFYAFFAATHINTNVALAVMGVSEVLLFITNSPQSTIIYNVTEPRVRAMATGVHLFVTHLLGEMVSPTLMGAAADRGDMESAIKLAAWVIGLSGLLWLATTPFFAADVVRARQHLERDPV
jgi:MFS family permease